MLKKQKRIRHIFLSLAVFGFMGSIFVFCTEHILGAGVMENEDCLTTMEHHDNLCKNDVAQHLAWWQALHTAFTQERFWIFLAVVSTLGGLLFSRYVFLEKKLFQIGKHYLRHQPDIPIFFSLRMLFSQGILHSKAY